MWHEYARYVSLSATACECLRSQATQAFLLPRLMLSPAQDTLWAAFWGIFYRKFFFDFVNGIVRSPGGLQ